MKNTEKRAVREPKDNELQSKYKFGPLHLDVKYPGTAVLLLKCDEKEILLSAAAALAKYGSRSKENLETLFDLEIVSSIAPLIGHEDLFTRRFAAKLLAEMAAIPNVTSYLMESDYYIPHFTNVLVNDQDMFMQEFSSLILAELSKNPFGTVQILMQCPNMNVLFERIQSPDPDVKKNCVEIMYNLTQDPVGMTEIISAKTFNLTRIYELFDSPYPEIQTLALNVTAALVSRLKDEYLQTVFRETKGLQALLDFLDNDEWQDLHAEAFRILSLALENDTNVESIVDAGGVQRVLKYMDNPPNPKLFQEAFNTIIRFSSASNGRKALYSSGIVDYLLNALRGPVQSDIYEASCLGVGRMSLHDSAVKEFTGGNFVKMILAVLKIESLKSTARQTAAFALNELLKCDIKNCNHFLDAQGQNYLFWLIKQPVGRVSIELQIHAVEGLIAIAKHPGLRNAVINADEFDTLCSVFELTNLCTTDLKIACCKLLSILCVEQTGRDGFLRARGPDRLYNLLSDLGSVPIRNEAAQLVQLLCADPVLANAFVRAKYLSHMLDNRSLSKIIPAWDACIEALFDSHLPIKFAFTGRLSLHDITQDGFYVMRRNVCPFPVLSEVLQLKFCPIETVYVVNCASPRPPSSSDSGSSGEIHLQPDGNESESYSELLQSTLAHNVFGAFKGVSLSSETVSASLDTKLGSLQHDSRLRESIELFKMRLLANEPIKPTTTDSGPGLVDIRYIASRAKMLARFVARQMSGLDPTTDCIDHQLEVHLRKIKDEIETSVIPLGMIRVGCYLERALLFKVIADRIALPASLVRGEYGRSWVEIAVPQVDAPVEEPVSTVLSDQTSGREVESRGSVRKYESSGLLGEADAVNINGDKPDQHRLVLPRRLMRPNFIVDLVNAPGDLIPIGSHRAKLYCQKQFACGVTPSCCA